MRKEHIDYLKKLKTAIGFTGKMLEIAPRADQIKREIPLCYITFRNVLNKLDARIKNRVQRLPAVVDSNGNKYLRYVVRHFKQEFRYQLNFLFSGSEIENELLSEPSKEGLIDKALRFVSANQYINRAPVYIGVDVGASGLITDESNRDIFMAFVEIIFRDGVYEEERVRALSGGTFRIVPPVKVLRENRL